MAFKRELPVPIYRLCRVSQEHPCLVSLLHQLHTSPVKISHPQYLIKIVSLSQVKCNGEPFSARTLCHSASFLIPVSFYPAAPFLCRPPICHPFSFPPQMHSPYFRPRLPPPPSDTLTFTQDLITVSAYPECPLSFVSHKVQFSSFLLSNQGVSFSPLRKINRKKLLSA